MSDRALQRHILRREDVRVPRGKKQIAFSRPGADARNRGEKPHRSFRIALDQLVKVEAVVHSGGEGEHGPLFRAREPGFAEHRLGGSELAYLRLATLTALGFAALCVVALGRAVVAARGSVPVLFGLLPVGAYALLLAPLWMLAVDGLGAVSA